MRELTKIYFAAAVRTGDASALRAQIRALEHLGEVTTRHLANPGTVDQVFTADQALLRRSHLFIGDFSTPSTSAGFMAARAVERRMPVLALFREGQRPTATLAGCPDVTTGFFSDDASFFREARAFVADQTPVTRLRAPRIFLAGPPGSGKGTLGAALSQTLGAPHVSAGALRARPGDHPLAEQRSSLTQSGQPVPAKLMRDLVLERLSEADCLKFGFILDGYPTSRDDLTTLTTADVEPDLVVTLECSDALAVQRQRVPPEQAKERLRVFHHDAPRADWFPHSVVMRVDAARPAAEVHAQVVEAVEHLFGDAHRSRSYVVVPPFDAAAVRSARVHFHVAGPSAEQVREVARRIHTRAPRAQGQVKVTPVEAREPGPQSKWLPIYAQLPNFSDDEAFLTGRLGDGDPALFRVALDVARALSGKVALEESLGEWTVSPAGAVTLESKYEPLRPSFAEEVDHLCKSIPPLELHLSFDVPRVNGRPPIALPELMRWCTDAGFDNGGWFVIKKDALAAYRSTEFSSEEPAPALARLTDQARALAKKVAVPVSFRLEVVHGIWVF